MNPVSSVLPVPFPVSSPKNAEPPFAVCSIPSETDADDIRVELYSPSRSIVVALVKGEGFRRVDHDGFIALNGRCVSAYLLGHDSIGVGVGVNDEVRLAWLSLYIPALDRGTSPDKLEFGTFSVDTTM